MFIRTKKRKSGKIAVQIVESHRRANKVSQHVVRHVGQGINDAEVEDLKKLAEKIILKMEEDKKRQPKLPLFKPMEFLKKRNTKKDVPDNAMLYNMKEEQRVIDGIGDVFGKLFDELGFNKILTGTRKNERWNEYLRTMVLARIANPVSKRRTASLLEEDYGIKMPLDSIYRTMEHIHRCEDSIKKHAAKKTLELFKSDVDVLFFDVTTLYFESFSADELRDFGFSKDCKFKETQVVLALVTTTNGLPITYRLFPGNTYEGHTLLRMVDELSLDYNIKNILLVADRAMFTEDNLKALEAKEIKYIVAAKLKGMSKSIKEQIHDPRGYRGHGDFAEIGFYKELEYKGRRLVVDYSRHRAEKDASDRNRLVERLLKKVKDGKIAIKDVIPNYGTKKYLKVKKGQKAEVNEAKIEEDAIWDGLHGVISNACAKDMSALELLKRYRGLWRIEEAFRINKHDLKMRPIYHYKPERIKAHISVCFIAYTLIKQALFHLESKKVKTSFEQLRNDLLHAQSSILMDVKNNKRYVLPSKTTQNQRLIYDAFGINRRSTPYVWE
jgi:transposase